VVPDGPARVVVRFRRGRTTTVPAKNNYFAAPDPEMALFFRARWIDAKGHEINRRAAIHTAAASRRQLYAAQSRQKPKKP